MHEELKAFEPEYYSGLNWRDALPLVGKVVEFSDLAEKWEDAVKRRLKEIDVECRYPFICEKCLNHNYIRTTPETHSHPTVTLTVNGREWVLPMWETEPLSCSVKYWWVNGNSDLKESVWDGHEYDFKRLKSGKVHLTESRARAWADFWQEAILGAVRG